MTLPRMAALNKSWKVLPPMAESVAAIAAWLGAISPPSRSVADKGNLAQLVEDFGMAGGLIEKRKR